MKEVHAAPAPAPDARSKASRAVRAPLGAVAALACAFVACVFTAGFDQGHLFSVFQGAAAFDELFVHELTHDMRHAAGLPCH